MYGTAERNAHRALMRLRRSLDKAARELETAESALRATAGNDLPARVFEEAAHHLLAVAEFIDEQEDRLEARLLEAGGIGRRGRVARGTGTGGKNARGKGTGGKSTRGKAAGGRRGSVTPGRGTGGTAMRRARGASRAGHGSHGGRHRARRPSESMESRSENDG